MSTRRFAAFEPATTLRDTWLEDLRAWLLAFDPGDTETIHVVAAHPWPKAPQEKKALKGPLLLAGLVAPTALKALKGRIRGHAIRRKDDSIELRFDKHGKAASKAAKAAIKLANSKIQVELAATPEGPGLGDRLSKLLGGADGDDYRRRAAKVRIALDELSAELTELGELAPGSPHLGEAIDALADGERALLLAEREAQGGHEEQAYTQLEAVKKEMRRATEACRMVAIELELDENAPPQSPPPQNPPPQNLPPQNPPPQNPPPENSPPQNLPPQIDPAELQRAGLFQDVLLRLDEARVAARALTRPALQTFVLRRIDSLELERVATSQSGASDAILVLTPLLARAEEQLAADRKLVADEAATIQNVRTWGESRVQAADQAIANLPNPPKNDLVGHVARLRTRSLAAWTLVDRAEFQEAQTEAGRIFTAAEAIIAGVPTALADFQAFVARRREVEALLNQLGNHRYAEVFKPEILRFGEDFDLAKAVADSQPGAGWKKATAALTDLVTRIENMDLPSGRLGPISESLRTFKQKFENDGKGPEEAQRIALYAARLMESERCTTEKAAELALQAERYRIAGLPEHHAIQSARLRDGLLRSGVQEDRATAVGHNMRLGGSSTIDDGHVVAEKLARLSTGVFDAFVAAGITTAVCRGPMTEVSPDSRGVQPRGWPQGSTWDAVPGCYQESSKRVIIGTMSDNTARKVPGKGEGPVPHGTPDLVGHEAGHAFDACGEGNRRGNTEFLAARSRDLLAGTPTGMYGPRDDYFLTRAEGGDNDSGSTSETFAESFALHFANGPFLWPELRQFWVANPWGI